MAAESMSVDPDTLSRAQGCLLGQLAGDSLGSLVEFKSWKYPNGVRELADGGRWETIAGRRCPSSLHGGHVVPLCLPSAATAPSNSSRR
ncbi:MAG: hypothetical protein WBL63_00735 [Candidatus Acidiferrum sp.]